MRACFTAILGIALISSPAFAAGSYSEGMLLLKIKKFESKGLIWDSWEGEGETTSFDKSEKCEEKDDLCYTPTVKKFDFSVRPDTEGGAKVVNFMRKAIGQEVLVKYRIHKFEAAALSSDFEVLEILAVTDLPEKTPDHLIVPKSGSKRNFSVSGRILSFEYRGTVKGSYEGLYLDKTKNKVHPFSVTNEELAEYAKKAMVSGKDFYMGISVAYVKGVRESNYDMFEINYKEPAGGVELPK